MIIKLLILFATLIYLTIGLAYMSVRYKNNPTILNGCLLLLCFPIWFLFKLEEIKQ
jgi:hypothetical protein